MRRVCARSKEARDEGLRARALRASVTGCARRRLVRVSDGLRAPELCAWGGVERRCVVKGVRALHGEGDVRGGFARDVECGLRTMWRVRAP